MDDEEVGLLDLESDNLKRHPLGVVAKEEEAVASSGSRRRWHREREPAVVDDVSSATGKIAARTDGSRPAKTKVNTIRESSLFIDFIASGCGVVRF